MVLATSVALHPCGVCHSALMGALGKVFLYGVADRCQQQTLLLVLVAVTAAAAAGSLQRQSNSSQSERSHVLLPSGATPRIFEQPNVA